MFCRRLCYSMDRYLIKNPAPKKIDTPPVKKLKTDSTVVSQRSTESGTGGDSKSSSSASSSTSIASDTVNKLNTDTTGTASQRSTESGIGGASGKPSSSTRSPASSFASIAGGGKHGFQLKMVQGDLFKCPASHSLAHCISEDIKMGKGIATVFKKEFGGVEDLKKQGVKTGGVAVLNRKGRFIYYLITKDKYWQKPTYDSLQSTLEAMANHSKEHKVTHIAMPRIGCGLDKLKWNTVADVIKQVFKDTDITVTVYSIDNKKDKKKK